MVSKWGLEELWHKLDPDFWKVEILKFRDFEKIAGVSSCEEATETNDEDSCSVCITESQRKVVDGVDKVGSEDS